MGDEYSKIQRHLRMSKTMYELDLKGRHIIKELQNKKSTGQRPRSGNYIFESALNVVYKNLLYSLSLKRLRLYYYLQYFLDELLFYEVQNLTQFYIEDDTYGISKVYFNQHEWITDAVIQPYEFYRDNDLNINEAMYLVCFLKEFDLFLQEIESYLKPYKHIKYIKSKLSSTIYKLRKRHNKIWTILLCVINQNFEIE